MNKPKNLLKMTQSMLSDEKFELKEVVNGLSPIYARIIFSNRLKLGYSQKKLAEVAGIGVKTVSRAESGLENLSTEIYDKLFKALGLSVGDIGRIMSQLGAVKDEEAMALS